MHCIEKFALALRAGVCIFCSFFAVPAFGQTLSDSPGAAGNGFASNEPRSVVEKAKASDSERITALEEAIRQQHIDLQQLRELIAEQTQMLKELRALPIGTPAARTSPQVVVVAGGSASETQSVQTGVAERVTAVEAQLKKNSESISKQLGSISFSGDIRLRSEMFFGLTNFLPNAANPTVLGNELSMRFRPRIRARLALRGQVNEQFDWGLRLATGSYTDNVSTNQTLTDFYNRKAFGLDQAFVTYKPKQVPGLRIQGGKFEPPWLYTEMTFDNDLMVEGLNESYSRNFEGTLKNVTLVGWQLPMLERNSTFVRNPDGTVNIDQSRRGGSDLALYGGNIRGRFEPSSKVALTISVSDHYFSGTQHISPIQVFGSVIQLPVIVTIPATANAPAQTITSQVSIPRDFLVAGNGNAGVTTASNNAINRDGRLASGFNLVDLIGRLELKHSRRFPVTLLLNFVRNTRTNDVVTAGAGGANLILPNNENNGLWAELQVGKTRERGDMQFGYTFMRIEKDAVLTPFNFSDLTQQSDMRGHRFNFAYAVDPKVTLSVIGIVTERLNGLFGPFIPTPPGSLNRATTRIQFDTSFRF